MGSPRQHHTTDSRLPQTTKSKSVENSGQQLLSCAFTEPIDIMVLGRLTHYAFDAVLISAFLAGVKRSTGLTPSFRSEQVSDNKEVRKWVDNYLWVGEVFMDQSVAFMSSSGYFERKR